MNTDTFSVLRMPREILFGEGQVKALGQLAAKHGKRALICTDARFAGTPAFEAIRKNLTDAGLAAHVFDAVEPDVPTANVYACADDARAFKPDIVIGLGGGSCMDMAKCAAIILTHGGKLEDYYGEFKVPSPVLPVIAVPTTAGTGSEATPVAVISDSNRVLKVGISSPHIVPVASICDPELTWTCPPMLTAIAGADALTHAIEAFTALRREPDAKLPQEHVFVGKNTFSDVFALKAITVIGRSLEAACKDGGTPAARSDLMLGALAAGCAFATAGTSLAHAVQYPVGALTHTPHGLGVAAMLPYALIYNRKAADKEIAEVGAALGLAAPSQGELATAAIARIDALFDVIGIPSTLKELGLAEDKIAWTAEQAIGIGRLIKNNPRAIDAPSMTALLDAAWRGDRAAAAL
ncbi:iron-containing alcohol dehydrogenase [Aestuariivirga sp.]|uniref:iron-containing alcohol dehydrogenase n=1 Tax=Aestuariivirga sp. TaxID=2650926 RepID=UPI0039E57BCA